ncbi:MAG: NAD(P)/FAD-dependent oxidoreductase [Firmicutes bacterium]|nr:NAD(P)/FAD-dependent oxidoreductase [Bacillota bacterium]MBQ3200061.1 NAD(P)/FAD-dependent oxidoreductase [Bacillota bacterium]
MTEQNLKQYVIIGNGVAAAGSIEGIRSADTTGQITVISQEVHPVYCRPLISYYLEGKTDLQRMQYRSADFYDKMGCQVLYGRIATKLDTAAQTVTLDDGTTLPYDELCIAAGSAPFVPPINGLDTVPDKFTFMTLDDTLALEQTIRPDSRVLIIGAGLIGLKCAEGLQGRVGSITVCDLSDRVLSSILDAECAALMQQRLEANGIHFMLGDTVQSFAGHTANMQSGCTVDFDVLVLAVGVRPNTSLLQNAAGAVERGILVDEHMATVLPHIYAAGDCTQVEDVSCGTKRVLAIMPNAYMQGYCAGSRMAGGSAVFDNAIPMNSIGFFGLHAMTAGSYDGEMYEERTADTLKRLFIRDNRLVGYILVGAVDRAGIYTALIRNQTPLDTLDFDLLKKIPTPAAFTPADRRKIFGGEI